MNTAWLLNSAWMWVCRSELRRFHQATRNVAETQSKLLLGILRQNQRTEFGVQHEFAHVRSAADYQRSVPLSTWEDYEGSINRIADGCQQVLTSERVDVFEPTSGSTRGEKLIPCTQLLRRQFQRAVSAWIGDLYQNRPAVRLGRAYWSISPSFAESRTTRGGIPIGFPDDSAWLGPVERVFLRQLLVVPGAVTRFHDMDNFRYCTLLHLIRASDLSLISVWSPTFLSALLSPCSDWCDRICSDLLHHRISLPGRAERVPRELIAHQSTDQRRADELSGILRSDASAAEMFAEIWPQLALISCWSDAAAAEYIPQLRELLPGIEIQPKGLLATEGCVSFPLVGRPGAVLAVRSHFFEFAESDGQSIRLAHELELGGAYDVILTTGGGLYRYQLYDRVEVIGFENECPLVRFLGRGHTSSDLVGEKLSEPQVRTALHSAFDELRIPVQFAIVVPVADDNPRYVLYLETRKPVDRQALAFAVQRRLEANPYYRQATAIGQLAALDIEIIQSGWESYERSCITRGQKPGDIKPTALDPRSDWSGVFRSVES